MPVKEGRKILFLWARFAFSSDGLKGQSRPKLVSQSIFGIHIWFCSCPWEGPDPLGFGLVLLLAFVL